MYDETLARTVREAGEAFTPPQPDVGTIVRRGRRARRARRPLAMAASVVLLIAGGAVVVESFERTETDVVTAPQARPPVTQWQQIPDAPIEARHGAVSVWTGQELIVWGGYVGNRHEQFLDGAAYDPARDRWTKLPASPLETSWGRTAVWTGTEMILWGGEYGDGSHAAPDTGAAYNPETREWRTLPDAPYWSLAGHSAVWTGTEMIVWGGVTENPVSGAIYDPARDRWTALPEGPLGPARHGHDAVWTGDEMIVWGGRAQGLEPLTGPEGAAFDPATGTWTPLPESPLADVDSPVSAWTGTEMIVTGGLSPGKMPSEGAAYDPVEKSWRDIAPIPVASERDDLQIVLADESSLWTGDVLLVVTADGILSYDPGKDRWSILDSPDGTAVSGAVGHWMGDSLIVWGGRPWDGRELTNGGWIAR